MCQLENYQTDGRAKVVYCDNTSEVIDLHSVQWKLAKKQSKPFLPLTTIPPVCLLQKTTAKLNDVKFVPSHEHKALLTICASSPLLWTHIKPGF